MTNNKSKDLIDIYKQIKIKKIVRNIDNINSIKDLTDGSEPSMLFYILADKLGYLLNNDPNIALSKTGIEIRKKINIFIKIFGKKFLTNPQVIENKKDLLNNQLIDDDFVLPKEPVIWIANHAFKDDTLATILAIKRNAYIVFGSLPQFYNTFDGITAWLNGVIMVNRKLKESRYASLNKAITAVNMGADLMIFPEGVWNKSPNKLILNLWPGVYKICKETGIKVVPVIHYIKDCANSDPNNLIHTFIDNPLKIDNMSEKDALEYLRDTLSTWYYIMMEKYGQSTRDNELDGFDDSVAKWETMLTDRVATADRYDTDIEFNADFRKDYEQNSKIWFPISNINNVSIENIALINEAKRKIKEIERNDFQRRF